LPPAHGAGGAIGFAQDKLTLQLKWVPQAQFAGYSSPRPRASTTRRTSTSTILPGGPNIAPEQVIAGGGADVIVTWMGGALTAREKGVPLVNIAQPYKRSGLMLICPKETGITRKPTSRARRSASGSSATSIRSSPG
jgi:NitT/TauT family transport system substrate-binding protein